jgi:hypothetical protein
MNESMNESLLPTTARNATYTVKSKVKTSKKYNRNQILTCFSCPAMKECRASGAVVQIHSFVMMALGGGVCVCVF